MKLHLETRCPIIFVSRCATASSIREHLIVSRITRHCIYCGGKPSARIQRPSSILERATCWYGRRTCRFYSVRIGYDYIQSVLHEPTLVERVENADTYRLIFLDAAVSDLFYDRRNYGLTLLVCERSKQGLPMFRTPKFEIYSSVLFPRGVDKVVWIEGCLVCNTELVYIHRKADERKTARTNVALFPRILG